jgi:hypothetical protein
VSGSGFTSQQRRIIMLMVIAVIVVLAMLAGFIVASLRNLGSITPVATLAFVSPPGLAPTPPPTSSLAPSPTPDESIWSQVQAARLFGQIAHQVETRRGLSPHAEVPLSFLDEGEMTALLRQLYTERDPQVHLLPYVALGLLPDTPVALRASQATAIYVPEQEQLYVATSRQESSADAQALLAHAYIHALQDQHFGLRAVDARAVTTDAKLAVQSLTEGDAMLSTAIYSYQDLAAAEWEHLTDLIVRTEQPDYGEELSRSKAWTRLQRFPYWEGRQFVGALFQAGEWETVNRAYTDLPRSTEQVLHPERYLEELDTPTSVVVPDLGAILDEGWTMALQDTLGEFVVGLYLDETLPEAESWRVSDGWDGDTFVVWEHEESGRRVRVWRTVWDSTAEATEFEEAFTALVPQRYLPAWPVEPPGGQSGRWWETDAGAVHVRRVARYVLFAQAPDLNTLTNIVGVLP